MELCASLAAALKLSPSLRSSRPAVASISSRSVSSFCRSLPVKSLWLEVMLVQRSLQPPPLSAVRIPRGHVAVALARHVKARLLQGGDDVGAALHGTVLDALHQVVPDQLARLCFVLKAGPQCGRFDVGAVSWLLRPGARRVVGPAPAVLVVEAVAQRVKGLLPAGRRDVEAAARLQVAPCGEDVHVHPAAALAVLDGRPRVAVGSSPAQAVSSNLSRTASICASVGRSSGAQAITFNRLQGEITIEKDISAYARGPAELRLTACHDMSSFGDSQVTLAFKESSLQTSAGRIANGPPAVIRVLNADPLPVVSLTTAALAIDEGMTETVAIIAEGSLANAVMEVGVGVTGDALISLLQDGRRLRENAGGSYTVDLDSTSTVLTIRADG